MISPTQRPHIVPSLKPEGWKPDEGWYYPPSTIKVRPYQENGIKFMRERKRVLNTDEAGLGKTMQAAFAAQGKVLVCVPNYLSEQWYDWLTGQDDKSMERNNGQVIPNVHGKVYRAQGSWYSKLEILRLAKPRSEGGQDAKWVIINHEALQTHFEEFEGELYGVWNTIIFDEAHHLRNHLAERGKTAVNISKAAEYVFLLTATPIWKEVDDLFNLFRILQPEIFTSYIKFVDQYCIAEKDRFGTKVLGVKKSQVPALNTLLKIMRIGRSYKQAGRQLPTTIEQMIKVQFPDELQRAYDQLISEWRMDVLDESHVFTNFAQVLNTTRQMTAYPGKISAMIYEIDQFRSKHPDKRIVIFCWYKDHAEAVTVAMNRIAKAVCITGDIHDPAVRRRMALDKSNQIVVATISSLSEGVDLSDARYVFFFEEHWPPGANHQAMRRVVRERVGIHDNQDEPVLVYYVHVKGTVDEKIHRVATRREASASSISLRDVVMDILDL